MRTNDELHKLNTAITQGFQAVTAQNASITSQLKTIETQITHIMADISAVVASVGKLLDNLDALLKADAKNAPLIASLQAKLLADVQNEAALLALAPRIQSLSDATAAATPAPEVNPPAPNPQGVLFDPTLTYIVGDTVLDAAGDLWTAVTPVLGEAPGVTEGNWIETTVATPPAA